MVGDAVALGDDRLEQTEQADRRDHADDRGRVPQRAQDDRLERERHQARGDHGDDERRQRRPTLTVLEIDERDVRRERSDRALGEVDEAGAAVDEHRALREQRVGGPCAQPDDQELQERLHFNVLPKGAPWSATSPDQQGAGAPNGEPHSTLSKLNSDFSTKLPLNPFELAFGSQV